MPRADLVGFDESQPQAVSVRRETGWRKDGDESLEDVSTTTGAGEVVSNFWLVEVEPDLEHLQFPTTRSGVWSGVKTVNGVRSLTDLRAITLETLATFLMSDEEFRAGQETVDLRRRMTSPDHVIRAYWKRVRQPKLPGVEG